MLILLVFTMICNFADVSVTLSAVSGIPLFSIAILIHVPCDKSKNYFEIYEPAPQSLFFKSNETCKTMWMF